MNKNYSNDSRNQFMNDSSINQQQRLEDSQKMLLYLKNHVNNQQLLKQLQKHLKQKQNEGSRIINQSIYYQQNLIQSRKQYPKQSYTDRSKGGQQNYQLYQQQSMSTSMVRSKDNRKKGTDVLSKYISNNASQNQQQKTFNEKNIKVSPQFNKIKNVANQLDERPINSNYHQNILAQSYADKKVINDVSIPAEYPIVDEKGQIISSSNLSQKKNFNKQTVKLNQNKFNSYEDIPINQLKSQFKNSLQNQSPFLTQKNQNDEEQHLNQQKKPVKQFLKRGTRQYLSSAKDRPSLTKKNHNDKSQQMNNSYVNQDRDKTPKREVSQNRILSKRNNNNTQKSQTKISAKNNSNLNTSTVKIAQIQKQQSEIPRRSITPRKAKPPINKPVIQNRQESVKVKAPQQSFKVKAPQKSTKKSKNIFEDEESSQEQQNKEKCQQQRKNNFIPSSYSTKQSSQKQYDIFSRQRKRQVIEGVYLTQSELSQILKKYGSNVNNSETSNNKMKQSKQIIQLRNKYTDLCNVLEQQKDKLQTQIQKKRQEFQIFKANELTKLKNQKRVMERQLKSSMPSHSQNAQRDKQQMEVLKKQLQKQRDQHKKRQKNNKILIEKYKKENQDLKNQMDFLQKQITQMKQNQQSLSASIKSNNVVVNNSSSIMNNNSKVQNKKSVSPSVSQKKSISKKNDQFEQNYKQTVPLNQKKKLNQLSQSSKSQHDNDSKYNADTYQNQDDYLPTFKVAKNQTKTQKKYEYVQKNSNQNSKVNNAFAKSSQSQSQKVQQSSGQSQNEAYKKSGKSGKHLQLADLNKGNISIKMITWQQIEKLFKYQNNPQYKNYLQTVQNPKRQVINSSKNPADKKVTNIYNDQGKEVLFQNGVKKQFFANGYTIIYFKNGDIKQKLTDGTILYYFNQKQVDQITLPGGLNIYRFDNNQVQFHFNNGHIQIRHPDGTIKVIQTQK